MLQLLYNLFEWPLRPGSRLALIAVANTMDLPERLLPRIASRLGGRRLVFQPYNRPQLTIIVSQRLENAKLAHTFAANAINMACSKVGFNTSFSDVNFFNSQAFVSASIGVSY